MAPLANNAVGDEPIPELLRLGEQLAQARGKAGLSLEAMAGRLKVEPRLLKSLELGDHGQLPEGVFIVALARRMAGSLNTNVDEAIASVRGSRLMQHKPPGRTPPPEEAGSSLPRGSAQAPSLSVRHPRGPATPKPSLPWRWPLAALLTACGAAAAWLLVPQTPSRGPSSPAAVAPSTRPAAAKKSPTAQGPSAGAPSPAAANADTLQLQANEPSWVEVRDADGRTIFEGTLSGEKSFPLGRGLEVISGRPYAVTAAIGPAPGSPLGGVDDIRWKRFTPAGPPSSSPTP